MAGATLPRRGRSQSLRTSGSTGMPVEVMGNDLTGFFWHVHLWARRDMGGTLAAIRAEHHLPH